MRETFLFLRQCLLSRLWFYRLHCFSHAKELFMSRTAAYSDDIQAFLVLLWHAPTRTSLAAHRAARGSLTLRARREPAVPGRRGRIYRQGDSSPSSSSATVPRQPSSLR